MSSSKREFARSAAMPTEALSYWLGEALGSSPPNCTPLEGSHRADVCIVGGGYTGLWTAIQIKRRAPASKVVLVERDLCGSGASGRNGGFVLSLWAKFLALRKTCGTAEAVRLGRLSSAAVAHIGTFCREEGIEADFRMDGWLWAATSPAQCDTWSETVAALDRAGEHPFQSWSADDILERSGSRRHLAGVFEAQSASVQPARLARGLRRVAEELGVEIYEQSPMLRLRHSRRPQVICSGGTVEAGKIILAMNAWGIRFAKIRRAIAVVSSDVVVTPPVPHLLAQSGWTDGMTISDSRMLVHYYRTTGDGRIVFGKGGGSGQLAFGARVDHRFEGPSPIADMVMQALRETYPGLGSVPPAQSWTGPIDRSRNGLPMFGRLDRAGNILYGVGYSGNGVGPSVLGGNILASLALEARDDWSQCGLVQKLERAFPPEPFRYVGGKLVRAAVARRDHADDVGGKPDFVTRALVRLAPAGLSPVRTPAEKTAALCAERVA